jgi:teichuronic acid biosynthesis glycosyltransferase TuaG
VLREMRPSFSFITCTYQCEKLVSRCYSSLVAQTISDWEWVIVDDASTDGTRDVVRELNDPRIRYFRLDKNSGRGVARSFALKQAKADWCAIVDMDDFCFPDRLEKADAARTAGYDFFCSELVSINQYYEARAIYTFNTAKYPLSFPHATLCGNTELLRTIGYPDYARAEDQTMILSLANNYKGAYCAESLYAYYENSSITAKGAILGQFYILKQIKTLLVFGRLEHGLNLFKFVFWIMIKMFVLLPFLFFPKAYAWTLSFRKVKPLAGNPLSDKKRNFISSFMRRFPLQ